MSNNTITGDIEEFDRLRAELLMDGYEQRAPDGMAAENDRELVREYVCAGCGDIFTYRPFTRRDPHSYRAFGMCANCDTAFEF